MSDEMRHIHKLADEIGPRPAGTNEEQLAATYIADEFKRRGLRAKVDEFSFTSPSSTKWAPVACYALTVLAALISNVNTALAVIAFILAILGFGLLCLERSERGIISNLGDKRGMSQNVVAHYVPQADARRRPGRPVVIVAHYDSQRNALQGMPALVSYYPMMRTAALAGCASVAAVCLLQALPFGFSDGGHTAIWVIGLLCAIPAMAGIVATVVRQTALRFADGANDNASGVAALLGVAERVMGITPISDPLPKAKPVEQDSEDAPDEPDVTQLWSPDQVTKGLSDEGAADGKDASGGDATPATSATGNEGGVVRAYHGASQETIEQPAIVIGKDQTADGVAAPDATEPSSEPEPEPEPEPYDPAEARIRRHTHEQIVASGVIPKGVRFVMTPEAEQAAERAERREQAAERAARAMVREAQQATDTAGSTSSNAAAEGASASAAAADADADAQAVMPEAAQQPSPGETQERGVLDAASAQGYFASHPIKSPGQQPDPSLMDDDEAEARLHAQAVRVAERRRREAAMAARERAEGQREEADEAPSWWTRSEQAAEQRETARDGGPRQVRRSRFADMPVEGTFAAAARAAQQRAAESRRAAEEARAKEAAEAQGVEGDEAAAAQETAGQASQASAARAAAEQAPALRVVPDQVPVEREASQELSASQASEAREAAQAEASSAADIQDVAPRQAEQVTTQPQPAAAEIPARAETTERPEASDEPIAEPVVQPRRTQPPLADDEASTHEQQEASVTYEEPRDEGQGAPSAPAEAAAEPADAAPAVQQSQATVSAPAGDKDADSEDNEAATSADASGNDDAWPTPVEPTPANPLAVDDFDRRALSPAEQEAQEAARRDAAARLEQARRIQQAEERATAQAEAERRAVIQAEALRRAHEAEIARRKAAVDREADEELGRIVSIDGRPHRDGHQSSLSSQIDALKASRPAPSGEAKRDEAKPGAAAQQQVRKASQQADLKMPDSAFLPSTSPDDLYASIDVVEETGTKTGVAVPQPIQNPSKSARIRRIGSIAQPDSTGAQDVLDFGSGTAVRPHHHSTASNDADAVVAQVSDRNAVANATNPPAEDQDDRGQHDASASPDDSLASVPLPSDSAQLRRLRLGALSESEEVDTQAPIQGTGTFAPIGDPYATGGVFGGKVIDDADDVADYGGDGELPASSRVDIPESRAHRFFDRLADRFSRRKKKQEDDDSLNEWLGVDGDYNARDEGRQIGSWDNFEEDFENDEDSWYDAQDDDSNGSASDAEDDGRDWKGGGATTGYRNGQSYDPNADANRPTQDVRSRPRRNAAKPEEADGRGYDQGREQHRGQGQAPQGDRERDVRHQRGARRHPAANRDERTGQRPSGGRAVSRSTVRVGSPAASGARPRPERNAAPAEARKRTAHDQHVDRGRTGRETTDERQREARQQIREQDAADQRRRSKSAARERVRREERKLREQVTSRAESDLFNREVWFVAAGASGAGHIGDREFIEAYGDKIKGAVVINVECVGAGQLTCVVEEGSDRRYKADSHDISAIARAAKRLNIPMKPGTQNWRNTDATPFYDRDMRAISVMGLDGTAPVGWCWGADAAGEVNPQTIVEAEDVIAQAIMNRGQRERES